MTQPTSSKKNEKPLVSVVMSVYNTEKFVHNAIESILNQTFTDFEFIIIDDASTDNTPQILHSFSKHPKIKIITNKKNIGLSKSLNKWLTAASGKYIARQDADDFSAEDRLEKQIAYLEYNTDVSLLGTGAVIIDNEGKELCIRHVLTKPEHLLAKFTQLELTNPLFHGSIMFRKSDIREIGNYREGFRYAQDHDLYLRLCEQKKIDNLDLPLYYWRLNPSGVSIIKYREQQKFSQLALRFATERKIYGKDTYSFDSVEKEISSLSCTAVPYPYAYKRAELLFQGEHFRLTKKEVLMFFHYPSLFLKYFYSLGKSLIKRIVSFSLFLS